MEENKPKRPRRTRAEIEAKVFDAIRQLADTKGLSNINFADICQYADVQPIVLNRNYETMEKLLDKYAYTCDYWLHDLFNSQHPTDQAGKDILKNTLQALAGHPPRWTTGSHGSCPPITKSPAAWLVAVRCITRLP